VKKTEKTKKDEGEKGFMLPLLKILFRLKEKKSSLNVIKS